MVQAHGHSIQLIGMEEKIPTLSIPELGALKKKL
jgi:hypothetical protein